MVPMALRIPAILFGCCLVMGGMAQNEEDALRIGTLMPGGTARSTGMANAFGALGADGVSIAINPAGLGLYRTSELSLTPALEVNDAMATYHGMTSSDTETRFHFSNLVLAINDPSDKDSDWRSSTYGVAFDRQATHHWRHQAAGNDVPGSILHNFYDQLVQYPASEYETALPFTGSLAWFAYGLDTLPGGQLFSTIPSGANTDQLHTRETRGASSNTSFFFAGNYKDRLYIGASVGIVGHRYRRTLKHQETFTNDDPAYVDRLNFREDLTTTGNGFEAKIGAIGRITDQFRLGVAFHTPQWLRLSDSYVRELSTYFPTADSEGNFNYTAVSPDGVYNYRLVTPWKGVFSAAYIIGKQGLFSLDYEYQDMRNMRFRPSSRIVDDYDFRAENAIMEEAFVPVHTVRAGTEWRTGRWYFRAGLGIATDPYAGNDLRYSNGMMIYALGAGYRGEHVGVDLGLNYSQRETRYFTYQYGGGLKPVVADLSTMRTLVTVSFRP